ncbi:MAG: helix-turn-helix domain-containing protein [Lachnospiraceae bacterium]|nr:helix-turn-helix domain-containing protein [Lachnospiraceae bacterium]MCR5466550.1 helix-turn-helix domain-containing protein [Lachnospiraceae bacterium]
MKNYVMNEHISGQDVKELRKSLGMTQKEFAVFVRVSLRTVENWERNDEITGPIVTLAEILKRQPKLVEKLEVPPKGRGLRLWYYFDSMVCSVIDADEVSREVKVYNYTDKPLYQAFGVNTEPTFEEYEAFLEERCFPKTRDKMKLELKRLGLPFYDPILIIEKTEGRMAGDRFWIRIER